MLDYLKVIKSITGTEFDTDYMNGVRNEFYNTAPGLNYGTINVHCITNKGLIDARNNITPHKEYTKNLPVGNYIVSVVSPWIKNLDNNKHKILLEPGDDIKSITSNFVVLEILKWQNKIPNEVITLDTAVKIINSSKFIFDTAKLYPTEFSSYRSLFIEESLTNYFRYYGYKVPTFILSTKLKSPGPNDVCFNPSTLTVLKVHTDREHNDLRICSLFSYCENRAYFLLSLPEDPLYDFLDNGNIILYDNEQYKNPVGVIPFDIQRSYKNTNFVNYNKVSKELKTKNTLRLLSEEDLNKFILPVAKNKLKEVKIKDAMLSKLLKFEFPIKFKGLTVNKDSFEYQNIVVKANCDDAEKLITSSWRILVNRIYANRDNKINYEEVINFNTLYSTFLSEVNDCITINWASRSNTNLSFSIDSIDINVSKTTKTSTSVYRINEIRVNRAELSKCISSAMCYTTQKDFDDFLKIVSKCSLKVHKIISEGVTFRLFDSILSNGSNCKLEFKRISNKNYLVINNKKIRVNSLAQFSKNLENCASIRAVCTLFNKSRFFPDESPTEKDLAELLVEGVDRYLLAIKKSEELLKAAVKATDTKIVENVPLLLNAQNVSATGYKVKGMSGNEYLVVETDRNSNYNSMGGCAVYIKNNDRYNYVCIVDKSTHNQVGKDAIVNRLFALKNDVKVTEKITTLKEFVGA